MLAVVIVCLISIGVVRTTDGVDAISVLGSLCEDCKIMSLSCCYLTRVTIDNGDISCTPVHGDDHVKELGPLAKLTET